MKEDSRKMERTIIMMRRGFHLFRNCATITHWSKMLAKCAMRVRIEKKNVLKILNRFELSYRIFQSSMQKIRKNTFIWATYKVKLLSLF